MTCPFTIGDRVRCEHDGEKGIVTLVMGTFFDCQMTGKYVKSRVFEAGWKWYKEVRG